MEREVLKQEKERHLEEALLLILPNVETVKYYLHGFEILAGRVTGGGRYLVCEEKGQLEVVLVFGEKKSPEELVVKIRKNEFSIHDYRGFGEKTEVVTKSPLVISSEANLPPKGVFALTSQAGSRVFLGIEERKNKEGQLIKLPFVIREEVP